MLCEGLSVHDHGPGSKPNYVRMEHGRAPSCLQRETHRIIQEAPRGRPEESSTSGQGRLVTRIRSASWSRGGSIRVATSATTTGTVSRWTSTASRGRRARRTFPRSTSGAFRDGRGERGQACGGGGSVGCAAGRLHGDSVPRRLRLHAGHRRRARLVRSSDRAALRAVPCRWRADVVELRGRSDGLGASGDLCCMPRSMRRWPSGTGASSCGSARAAGCGCPPARSSRHGRWSVRMACGWSRCREQSWRSGLLTARRRAGLSRHRREIALGGGARVV